MFYRFINDMYEEIAVKDTDPECLTAGYIPLSEFESCYTHFGFARSTMLQCKEEKHYFKNNICKSAKGRYLCFANS